MRPPFRTLAPPFAAAAVALAGWHLAARSGASVILPAPVDVARGLWELASSGLLFRYVVASLFRVTWGYCAAVAVAVPFGIALGLWRRGELAFNPVIQMLRPISPLAWIPISILWFGVGDVASIFLIFLASFFPMTLAAMNAVHAIDPVHLNAGRNFGLSRRQLVTSIVLPAILPQLVVGLRITLGVAWLVVVAAEMIAVSSGLGFLIIDARNAGNRYDLVVAGMVMIGVIGLALDVAMRRLEQLRSVRWGFQSE